MKFSWYANRVVRMSPNEIYQRLADARLKRRWRPRRGSACGVQTSTQAVEQLRFHTGVGSGSAKALPSEVRERLLHTADAALAGRFSFFDRERSDLSSDPDWFLDPRTGVRAPSEAYAFDIDCRDPRQVGAIKYVWEPSRHYHLTVLAAAYFLTSDARYADFVAAQLRSWWRANPFLCGVHWTSGIELGIRLISWVWIRRLLAGWTGAATLFERNAEFLQQLHHHQEYLAELPSHGSSANNHIIAEAAGQFVASCAFPLFPATHGWRKLATSVLCREAKLQTFDSGLNRELASSYHVFVLELFLTAAIEGEAAGYGFGPELWQPIGAMTDTLAAVVDVRGQPPRQGDGDHGRALLLDHPEADPCAALLATGAALFGRCNWWPRIGASDLRTLMWRALVPGVPPIGKRPSTRRNHFADAGMVLLRDRAHTEEELWCRCDHGPHGYLSIAAHAHADALSLELRCGGVEVLVDPGTYVYQGEPKWRSYFRSTIGHNCLELAGQSQSVSGGPFMWIRLAKSAGLVTSGLDKGGVAIWRATHDGYLRLTPGARHERSVTLHRDDRRLVVEDLIMCSGRQECRLAFHIGPEVECDLAGRVAHLWWQTVAGQWSAVMQLPERLEWEVVRGQTSPPLGWYSPCFGSKLPIASLVGRGVAVGGEPLSTDLVIDFRRPPDLGGEVHQLFLADAPE